MVAPEGAIPPVAIGAAEPIVGLSSKLDDPYTFRTNLDAMDGFEFMTLYDSPLEMQAAGGQSSLSIGVEAPSNVGRRIEMHACTLEVSASHAVACTNSGKMRRSDPGVKLTSV
eukprot:scaffold271278_cov30-Tisochrysis_lutea.AAC.6